MPCCIKKSFFTGRKITGKVLHKYTKIDELLLVFRIRKLINRKIVSNVPPFILKGKCISQEGIAVIILVIDRIGNIIATVFCSMSLVKELILQVTQRKSVFETKPWIKKRDDCRIRNNGIFFPYIILLAQ